MFKNIIESLKQLTRTSVAVDPSKFEDPVATSISWTPLKRGGANFCTHKLVEITPDRIGFLATLGLKLFLSAFVIGGIVAMGFGIYGLVAGKEALLTAGVLVPLIFGLLFTGSGAFMFYYFAKPAVFDKTTGMFYKGRKAPMDEILRQSQPNAKNKAVQLNKIHALQLISEYCHSSGRHGSSSYYSYELNLVLTDGERINVVDHGKRERIRQDANTLSNFLGKPVWDAT